MADSKKHAEQQDEAKRPYQKPEVKSAKIFERLALGCGLATVPPCRPPAKSG